MGNPGLNILRNRFQSYGTENGKFIIAIAYKEYNIRTLWPPAAEQTFESMAIG